MIYLLFFFFAFGAFVGAVITFLGITWNHLMQIICTIPKAGMIVRTKDITNQSSWLFLLLFHKATAPQATLHRYNGRIYQGDIKDSNTICYTSQCAFIYDLMNIITQKRNATMITAALIQSSMSNALYVAQSITKKNTAKNIIISFRPIVDVPMSTSQESGYIRFSIEITEKILYFFLVAP